MSATYTKLQNGSWGVRATGKLAAGATVTVTKKDGGTKVETVEKVLWSGKDNKTGALISLCAIAQREINGRFHYGGHRYRDDENCTCDMCSSGNECLCRYGRG